MMTDEYSSLDPERTPKLLPEVGNVSLAVPRLLARLWLNDTPVSAADNHI
jgi:hypothetical protein